MKRKEIFAWNRFMTNAHDRKSAVPQKSDKIDRRINMKPNRR